MTAAPFCIPQDGMTKRDFLPKLYEISFCFINFWVCGTPDDSQSCKVNTFCTWLSVQEAVAVSNEGKDREHVDAHGVTHTVSTLAFSLALAKSVTISHICKIFLTPCFKMNAKETCWASKLPWCDQQRFNLLTPCMHSFLIGGSRTWTKVSHFRDTLYAHLFKQSRLSVSGHPVGPGWNLSQNRNLRSPFFASS